MAVGLFSLPPTGPSLTSRSKVPLRGGAVPPDPPTGASGASGLTGGAPPPGPPKKRLWRAGGAFWGG
eukprot:15465847-Alexandrium_andersonii.AAC.1